MSINLPHGVTATILEHAPSTMDAGRVYDLGEGVPHWIMARTQTAGRGRLGKPWVTDASAFAATLVMCPNGPAIQAAQRSFVTAVALREALLNFVTADQLTLKWPNDVLIAGGKVAGILLESVAKGQGVERLMIGVGVNLGTAPQNVQNAKFSPVGLADVCENPPNQTQMLSLLAHEYAKAEHIFQTQGFTAIRQTWSQNAHGIGKLAEADTGRDVITGQFTGIDDMGAMMLLTPDGPVAIPAADVRFRT